MNKFICDICKKEKNTYPRITTKENKQICWECSTLECFNKYEKEIFDNLKKEIKKYMLESPYTPHSIAIFMINDLLEFIKNRNHIENFDKKFNRLEEELEMLKQLDY